MRQRETALLKSADLVLTGGPRLYQAKRASNRNVLCLPSAVDADHYATERATGDAAAMAFAAALQPHASPRLGFFGVIDERLDIDLVARLADADPTWQIVMVGPVVKIDSATLPRRANLHWLGQQRYAILPQLVAGWDVCLMPFALNESTEFISPTKTLEYMAAGKPVVSTPIHDVTVMFGDLVAIAATPESFIAQCRAALAESSFEKAARKAAMRARVAHHSWDAAVATILLALEALPPSERDAAATAADAAVTRARSLEDATAPPPIAAIG
jgi:glycosyltransferase involved in cell wall biosynthesis